MSGLTWEQKLRLVDGVPAQVPARRQAGKVSFTASEGQRGIIKTALSAFREDPRYAVDIAKAANVILDARERGRASRESRSTSLRDGVSIPRGTRD